MVGYIAELIYIAPVVATTAYHAYRFNHNIKTGKWFHLAWACIHAAIIVVLWLLSGGILYLLLALIAERFILYNQLLNGFRKPIKPFFYLSTGGVNSSWLDRLYYQIYVPLWFTVLSLFIIVQIFL